MKVGELKFWLDSNYVPFFNEDGFTLIKECKDIDLSGLIETYDSGGVDSCELNCQDRLYLLEHATKTRDSIDALIAKILNCELD